MAIEWSNTRGAAAPASTTASCALAWGCSSTPAWGGGNVFVMKKLTPPADVVELDASQQNGTVVRDVKSGILFGNLKTANEDGVRFWNLDNTYLQRSGGPVYTQASQYTNAYWIKWRPSDSGYRTLLRHQSDHCALVKTATKELGMYSNRNGGFRGTGYNITTGEWRFIVAVGNGTAGAAMDSIGTTTFYSGGKEAPHVVGTANGVCSGMNTRAIGWPGQGPGKLAQLYSWNRMLSAMEIQELYDATRPRYHFSEGGWCGFAGVYDLKYSNGYSTQYTITPDGVVSSSDPRYPGKGKLQASFDAKCHSQPCAWLVGVFEKGKASRGPDCSAQKARIATPPNLLFCPQSS